MIAAALTPVFGALPKSATDMEAASGKVAIGVRTAITTPALSLAATARNKYGDEVCTEFKPVLASKNPDARLNTAIMMAQLQTLSSDSTLMGMLDNPDSAVRYWGAKGLGGKELSDLEKLADPKRVIAALRAAAKKEKIGAVQQEIVRALATYDDSEGVLDGVETMAAGMPGIISDSGTLDAITTGLDAVNRGIKNAPAPQKTRAAKLAAQVASDAAQQQVAFNQAQQAIGGTLPAGYAQSVSKLVDAAIKVINGASGGSFRVDPKSTPDEMLFNLNNITGSSGRPGELQKLMKDVPVPGAIEVRAVPVAPTTLPVSTTQPHK